MSRGGKCGDRPYDRRRWSRVHSSVPVQVYRSAGEGATRSVFTAQSLDVSAGGLLIVASAAGRFVPGEVVKVSAAIPLSLRHQVPFSRIAGSCRVVRVDTASAMVEGQGVALAFCGNDQTMLGAIVFR